MLCFKDKVKQPSTFDLNKQLIEAKKESDLHFLSEVHSDVLTNACERSKITINKVFKGLKQGKFNKPKFKNKYTYLSFTFKRYVEIIGNCVKLPKIGKVKFHKSRELPVSSKIKYCSIIKKLDGWYINIQVEITENLITIDESQAVGIDVGVKVFAYLSDGTQIKSPYFVEPQLRKLRILNRKLSRCKKGSKRRDKIKLRLAKLYLKITRQRRDFNHKVSTRIANQYDLVIVEDLKIKEMKGNSTLTRRMLDNGFYQFRTFISYKAKAVEAIPAYYTSQKCSACGHIDSLSRVSQSIFFCTNCGNGENADFNASKNILALGRSLRTKRKAVA